jgi:hypothetical protein
MQEPPEAVQEDAMRLRVQLRPLTSEEAVEIKRLLIRSRK